MSVQRFQSTGVDVASLQMLVEAGLTASSPSWPMFVDITLTDDSLLPDLILAMEKEFWSFVASAPTTLLPSLTTTEVEIDFGTKPVTDARFTIAIPEALPTSKITVALSGKTATGRTPGDAEWDGFSFGANPGTGSITLYVTCTSGSVVGKRVVAVTVNNL